MLLMLLQQIVVIPAAQIKVTFFTRRGLVGGWDGVVIRDLPEIYLRTGGVVLGGEHADYMGIYVRSVILGVVGLL